MFTQHTNNHSSLIHTIIKVLAFVVFIVVCINLLCMLWTVVQGRDSNAGAGQYCVLVKVVDAHEQMFEAVDSHGRRYTIPQTEELKNYQTFILLLDDNKTNNVNDDVVLEIYPEVWRIVSGY